MIYIKFRGYSKKINKPVTLVAVAEPLMPLGDHLQAHCDAL